jgi:Zn-dependent protease
VRLAKPENVVEVKVEGHSRISKKESTLRDYTLLRYINSLRSACYNPSTAGDVMLGLDAPTLIARIFTLIIAFTIHELAHAWTAVELGDDTPRRMGRLTLNPLAHLDLLGSLLLIVAGFGWAKPVLTNPYNFRNGPRLGMAIVAAAGPFSNLVMALIAALPLRLGLLDADNQLIVWLAFFLEQFIFLNIILMLFNLLPIAPLDGSKVLRGFAPPDWDRWLAPLEMWGPFILLALVFLGRFGTVSLLGLLIGAPALFLYRTIVGF